MKYNIELAYFATSADSFSFPCEIEAESEVESREQLKSFFIEQADCFDDDELKVLQGLDLDSSVDDALSAYVRERMRVLTINEVQA